MTEYKTNIFFTADTHFYHKGIIETCNRPFLNYEEMNEGLIKNWNDTVDVLDDIYVLGDFIWRGNKNQIEEIIYRLNGRIHIIRGNHDHKKQAKIYEKCSNVAWVKDYYELKINNDLFVLFHYPMRSWNKSVHGSYHLYGHTHGNIQPYVNTLEVGVDIHNYKPIHIDYVYEQLNLHKTRVEHGINA